MLKNGDGFPKKWSYGAIAYIYKNKGKKTNAMNYRPICLTNIGYKIWSGCITRRIQTVMNLLTETIQYGYKEHSSCIDALRKVHLFQKNHKDGELLLMDLSKAFDSIDRDILWTALYRKGLPVKLILMLIEGHKVTQLMVKNKGTYGTPIQTDMGVFQGAAFSALGFIIYMCDMLEDFQALTDEAKLPNTYQWLPNIATREVIARSKIYRQAGISTFFPLPRVPIYTQKELCKQVLKKYKCQKKESENVIQELNTKLMMLEDKYEIIFAETQRGGKGVSTEGLDPVVEVIEDGSGEGFSPPPGRRTKKEKKEKKEKNPRGLGGGFGRRILK